MAITLRSVKGSALTHGEMDENFTSVADNYSNQTISGSKTFTKPITGSLNGNASTATSSSSAISSSYALFASQSISSSRSISSSFANNALSSSYTQVATTASYALNVLSASYSGFANTASYILGGGNFVHLTGDEEIHGHKSFVGTGSIMSIEQDPLNNSDVYLDIKTFDTDSLGMIRWANGPVLQPNFQTRYRMGSYFDNSDFIFQYNYGSGSYQNIFQVSNNSGNGTRSLTIPGTITGSLFFGTASYATSASFALNVHPSSSILNQTGSTYQTASFNIIIPSDSSNNRVSIKGNILQQNSNIPQVEIIDRVGANLLSISGDARVTTAGYFHATSTTSGILSGSSGRFSNIALGGIPNAVTGGIYLPSFSSSAFPITSSFLSASYIRIGNKVMVYGMMNISSNAAGAVINKIVVSLPIPTTITDEKVDCCGVISTDVATDHTYGVISGSATFNSASFFMYFNTSSNNPRSYNYMYTVK